MYRLERSKAAGEMPLTRNLMAMSRIWIWAVVHCRNGRAAVFLGLSESSVRFSRERQVAALALMPLVLA